MITSPLVEGLERKRKLAPSLVMTLWVGEKAVCTGCPVAAEAFERAGVPGAEAEGEQENQNRILEEIAVLVKETKATLRSASDGIMDDFLIKIIRLSSKNPSKDKPT
jgi:hypothetical protein